MARSLKTVSLLLSLVVVTVMLAASVISTEARSSKRLLPSIQLIPQPYGLSIPYYSTRGSVDARLTLNNKGIQILNPRVTLYSRTGQRFVSSDIFIGPRTFKHINLKDLVAQA